MLDPAFVSWDQAVIRSEGIRRYILFHRKRHPAEMNVPEINAFLSHLAVRLRVSASTQNQALNALVFLYKKVLFMDLDGPIRVIRARRPSRLPAVLSKAEVQKLLAVLSPEFQIMARLLYGSGLRLMECLRLRVKDLDFERREITVRDGKGMKDRVTMPALAKQNCSHLILEQFWVRSEGSPPRLSNLSKSISNASAGLIARISPARWAPSGCPMP
jgi:site-specific recombinase XerD